MNILILYGTTEGQTQKIANHISAYLRYKNFNVTEQSGERLPLDFDPRKFDAVIVGGSVHMGRYQGYITKFVTAHRDWLNSLPSALFTVCMAANSQRASEREEALAYGERLLKKAGWQPRLTETFAGAVKYTQYNPVTRFIMKMISKHEGGSTDTSQDHEYTDWDAVTHFAERFVEVIGELQPA